jgi:hypothetical protein
MPRDKLAGLLLEKTHSLYVFDIYRLLFSQVGLVVVEFSNWTVASSEMRAKLREEKDKKRALAECGKQEVIFWAGESLGGAKVKSKKVKEQALQFRAMRNKSAKVKTCRRLQLGCFLTFNF